ncbi:hypothetical protein HY479_03415 [Candidatus Uhrbacteria bacterium]|nr:hypothetical protein [Candidatus Uhrbacteria bacterium]
MSLQHVLDVARKNGMPVIVTDAAGREPMVVMPLEQFEAMAGWDEEVKSQKSKVKSVEGGLDEVIAEASAERATMRMEDAAREMEEIGSRLADDAPLEERFYLEPVTDN